MRRLFSRATAPRRLEPDWNGVSASILEGIDEMLTVTRLGLPRELRRSLACTNIIENVMGTAGEIANERFGLFGVVHFPGLPRCVWALGRRRQAGSNQGLPSIEGHTSICRLFALLLQSKANSR